MITMEAGSDPLIEAFGLAETAVRTSEGIAVRSPEDEVSAIRTLKEISDAEKRLKSASDQAKEPAKKWTEAIDAKVKPIRDALAAARSRLNSAVLAYGVEKKRAAAEANRIAEEAAREKAKLAAPKLEDVLLADIQGKPAPAAPSIVVPPPVVVAKTVKVEGGPAATVRVNKKWRLVDRSKIPAEYLILDEVKIGKVVRAGAGSTIPGIEVYEEENLSIR